jgi:hypothetical protein
VPTTWNGSPRDSKGNIGAFEAALMNTKVANAEQPLEILRTLAEQDDRVRVFTHARNAGQAAAITSGVALARGSTLVSLDDDLQHRPEDIPLLLRRLAAADARTLVMAVPQARLRPWWRDAASWTANVFSNTLLERPLPLRLTAFCAFQKDLAAMLVDRGSNHSAAWTATLVQAAERTITVPIQIDPSGLPRSRYGLRALLAILWARTPLYSLRRMIVLAVAAILVAVAIAATGTWLSGARSISFLPFAAIAAVIATITVAVAWATIVQRRRIAREEGPPVPVSTAAENAVRSQRKH